MRKPWLLSALVLSSALAVLEELTLRYYLLWYHPWFDTVLHATGGAAIGALAVGLLRDSFRPVIYLAFVAVAALTWEFFEYSIGSSQVRGGEFILDTSSDLLFDALGALVPYAIARYTLWRRNPEPEA